MSTRQEAAKTAGSAGKMRRSPVSVPAGASSAARRQAAAILEVLAGMLRPAEAAQVLETSLPRYYQLERRALAGLLAGCEPAPRGPRIDPGRQMAAMERENRRLRRECDRQQALVRAAERALGLVRPSAAKPSAKGKEESTEGNGKPRRGPRRPAVRALRAVRTLRAQPASEGEEDAATEGVPSLPVAAGT